MTTPVNDIDILLQATSPRIIPASFADNMTLPWTSVASRPTNLATLNATDGTTLSTAYSNSVAANAAIADMAADSILSSVEKPSVRLEFEAILNDKSILDSQATSYGIITEKTNYDDAFQRLATYLNAGTTYVSGIPNWINDTNISSNTTIIANDFRWKFSDYYYYAQILIQALTNLAAQRAIWGTVSAKPTNVAALGGSENIKNSLALLNSPSNMVTDDSFSDPDWWGAGSTWPSGWSHRQYTYSGEPTNLLTGSNIPGGFDYSSKIISVKPGGIYKVRLTMLINTGFTGFIAPLVHFPSVSWAIPGSSVADPSSVYPDGHTLASWGSGWQTKEIIITAGSTSWIQTRICGRISGADVAFYMEVTPLFGSGDQITSGNYATYMTAQSVSLMSYSQGSSTPSSTTSYCDLYFDSDGKNVLLTVTGTLNSSTSATGSPGYSGMAMELKMNGTSIFSIEGARVPVVASSSLCIVVSSSHPVYVASPGTGSIHYELTLTYEGGSSGGVAGGVLRPTIQITGLHV